MHIAKVLRFPESQRASYLIISLPDGESTFGDELLSPRRDFLRESHDRDYRSLRIFFAGEFPPVHIRVRVFDINHELSKNLVYASMFPI